MISIVAEKIYNYLDQNKCINKEKDIYIYGLKLFVSTCIGTGILLFIGLISNHFIEAIIFEIIISSSRSIMGGYHAKTHTTCIISYVGMFIIGIIWLNYHVFNFEEIFGLSIISIITTVFLSPIENVNKILSIKKKKLYKVYSMLYSLIYINIMLILYYLRSQYLGIIFWCLILINILTIGGRLTYEEYKK